MLFVFIDLLEKILAWLKPFRDKTENLADILQNNRTWSSTDLMSFRAPAAAPPDIPVVTELLRLKADPEINVDPKATGTIYDLDGRFVYGPETVSRGIWGTLFGKYGKDYQFYIKKDRKR